MNCTHVFSSGWYEIQSITNPTKDTTQTCKGKDVKCVKVKKTLQNTKILFFFFPPSQDTFLCQQDHNSRSSVEAKSSKTQHSNSPQDVC